MKFSKRLAKIEQKGDRVVLHFSDGEVVAASVLVGSDGIQSVARQHVLESLHSEQVEATYANSYAYRAVISMADAKEILGDLTDTAKMYVGQNRIVVTYRISGGAVSSHAFLKRDLVLTVLPLRQEFNFLHCVCEPEQQWRSPESMTEEVSKDQMLADFEDHGIDKRLLLLLEKARPIRWGLFHHVHTSTYFRERAVLIGDSAHASLPYQAAGAGQGVEDALILSAVLGQALISTEECSQLNAVRAALGAYDEIRRPRAQKQTEQSLDAALLLSFQDSQAGSDMEKVLERMQGDRFDWLWFHDLKEDVKCALAKMDSALRDK